VTGAACAAGDGDGGGSGADGPDGPSTTVQGAAPEQLAVTDLGRPADGQARLALGGRFDVTLDVTTCTRDLDAAPDGEVPSEQVVVEATGEVDGVPLSLSVRRYRSQGASPTTTDTVRVTHGPPDAPTAVLEAQRFEVDGLVTDPRDPDADDPLLRVTDAGIAAEGMFAPPGAFADDGGLVEGAVSVGCAA
jgi:hypothetical protein